MKHILILVILTMLNLNLQAQITQGGEPNLWSNKGLNDHIPFVKMPQIDIATLEAEDLIVDSYKETPYRFGVDHNVDIDLFEQGISETLPEGDVLWTLGIECPNAKSINFVFGEFVVPSGGEVFVYNENRSSFLGSFTEANMKEFGSLAIGVLHTDKIIIEYKEPSAMLGISFLKITQVTHGYRQILSKDEAEKGPFGVSGSCNINVNCPDADPWQSEKRSVGLILTGGSICTGSLINNTNNNGVPYFLTAEHCSGGEANWVVYFNHEYSGCSNSGSAPTNQSISGVVVKASNPAADGHLTQLTQNIPASYQPYYNGWDNSGSFVSSAVSIHHPSGDVKKISFDDDPLQKTFYGSSTPTSSGNNWRIDQWERNTTTEGGSSGSPLYDQDHRLIGTLQGGGSTCSNDLSDWYGAFDASFSNFSIFLAPGNADLLVLDGYDPYAIPQTELHLKALLEGPLVPAALVMTDALRQSGTIPLTEPFSDLGFNHVSGGGETINSTVLDVTGANAILDWIFVELRSSLDPTEIVATQSALIQRDGDIVSTNGVSSVVFFNLTGSVHVVLRHRNHFGMRSFESFPTSVDVDVDFTDTSLSLYGGADAMTTYGSIRAMIAADANRDGQVNTVDKNTFWRLQNGQAFNYSNSSADFDLNGVVNTIDKNNYWQLNNSKVEQLD